MSQVIYSEKKDSHVFEIVHDTTGAIWPFKYLAVKRVDDPRVEECEETRKCRTEDDALTALAEMM